MVVLVMVYVIMTQSPAVQLKEGLFTLTHVFRLYSHTGKARQGSRHRESGMVDWETERIYQHQSL